MSRIKITPEEVRSVAAQFHTASDQSHQIVSHLGSTVRGLDSDWEGATKRRFYEEYTQWDARMQEFVQLLAAIGSQLEEIANAFEEADNAGSMVGTAVHHGPGGLVE